MGALDTRVHAADGTLRHIALIRCDIRQGPGSGKPFILWLNLIRSRSPCGPPSPRGFRPCQAFINLTAV